MVHVDELHTQGQNGVQVLECSPGLEDNFGPVEAGDALRVIAGLQLFAGQRIKTRLAYDTLPEEYILEVEVEETAVYYTTNVGSNHTEMRSGSNGVCGITWKVVAD